MSIAIETIRLMALNLEVGETSRHLKCPICNGGNSGESSLVISRKPTAIFYKCYRVSCGDSGVLQSNPMRGDNYTKPKPPARDITTRSLSLLDIDFLNRKYELSPDSMVLNQVKFNVSDNCYYFPLFDIEGNQIGELDRRFGGQVRYKALHRWYSDDVLKIAFPKQGDDYKVRLYIVEDLISAIKMSMLGIGVCTTLGTYVDDAMMVKLSKMVRGITFVYDPDALHKALLYRQKYNAFFKHPIAVYQLEADPKNTSLTKLESIFGHGKQSTDKCNTGT